MAAVLPRPALEAVLDDALSRRLVTCTYLRRRLAVLRNRQPTCFSPNGAQLTPFSEVSCARFAWGGRMGR